MTVDIMGSSEKRNINERYATLHRYNGFFGSKRLELTISQRKEFLTAEDNNLLGRIKFESEILPKDIAEKFSSKYCGEIVFNQEETYLDINDICTGDPPSKFPSITTIRFPSSTEPTITKAFGDYFSNFKE